MMAVPTRRHPRSSEQGFSTVEILVGIMLLTIVVGGFMTMLTGSFTSKVASKARERQVAVGEAAWERIQGTGGWARKAPCSSAPDFSCPVPASVYESAIVDAVDGAATEFSVTAIAKGVDARSDGVGAADRDGANADVFNVSITVTQTERSTANLKPFVIGGTFDPSKAGTNGSIRLQVCQVRPQVDERMTISSCPANAPARRMTAPPERPGGLFGEYEQEAWDSALAMEQLTGSSVYTHTLVEPVLDAQVEISGPSGSAPQTVREDGFVRFTDLKPGRYKVTVRHPDDDRFVPWNSHSVPAAGEVIVSAGEEARSIQAFQPTPTTFRLKLFSYDDEGEESGEAVGGGYWLRLMPVPVNRSSIWEANVLSEAQRELLGWVHIEAGQDEVTMRNVSPGLYAAAILRQAPPNQLRLDDVDLEGESDGPNAHYASEDVNWGFIWVDPSGDSDKHLPVQFDGEDLVPQYEDCSAACGYGEPFANANGGA